MPLILVGGGSRSGKSAHALQLARQCGPRRGFLATAQAFDDEMRSRIALHQSERGSDFTTLEEPLYLAAALAPCVSRFDVVVIDCLTLWLSNVMLANVAISLEAELQSLAALPLPCICVTNEVGCGIVPENALAREFRDRAGLLNQHAAHLATEVYYLAFGLPLRLK